MPVRGAQRTRLRSQGLGGNPVDNQMDNPDERAGAAPLVLTTPGLLALTRKTREGGRQNRR